MKFLFDIFPLILFFAAFKMYDIYVATAVAMGATVAQIGWLWLRGRKIDKILWVSLGLITVFGGATLIFQDDTFIKWKPTVLYWLFGIVLAVAWIGFRRNLVRSMMEKQITLPDAIWARLLASWIAFFGAMGALNLYVAYNFSQQAWVDFKVFGGIALPLIFMVVQILLLSKHLHDKNERA